MGNTKKRVRLSILSAATVVVLLNNSSVATAFTGKLNSIGFYPAPLDITRVTERSQVVEARFEQVKLNCIALLEARFSKKWPTTVVNSTSLLQGLATGFHLGVNSGGLNEVASTSGAGNNISIDFQLELFLDGAANVETTGCHEIVHAYFRRYMNSARYSDLPKWAREGMAVYLSDQTQEKLQQFFSAKLENFVDYSRALNGLEGPHTLNDYLEDALAFESMNQLAPEGDGAQKVLEKVLVGVSIEQAIESTLHLSFDEFKIKATEYSRARLELAKSQVGVRFLAAVQDQVSGLGRWSDAKAKYLAELNTRGFSLDESGTVFKEKQPATTDQLSFAAASALRNLSTLMAFTGQKSEKMQAIKIVEFLLSDSRTASFFGGAASLMRYELAGLYRALAQYNAALHSYSRVYGESVGQPQLRAVSGKWIGQSLMELGQNTAALEWLSSERIQNRDEETKFWIVVLEYRLAETAEDKESAIAEAKHVIDEVAVSWKKDLFKGEFTRLTGVLL